ncbi:MAG: DUF4249 domain-containing protein [Algoriphagus sp.]|uniref:DUF4249 domain-containing protein n=1 Tax=Algoriphagus sp. TaxID=1872435 RepID=UPI001EC139F8|nr:DUF4249 domain-containing protein [Algoriphagus sp.]MBA4300922.1 hypothetical protein [Cyclobacterium sp.]MDP2041161.1 DUF4249 domain-containing protein [Algoriphagus sp.]MDP3471786.1 DUF4249 domain-containing protein [Algoriphagus sp.]
MMTNSIKSSIPLVLLLSVIWGCEQFLEVELPGQEPRLVLNALIEPNDTIKVFLTKSRSILEGREYDGFEYVKGGKVFLKNEAGAIFPFGFIDKSNPIESFAYYYLAGYDFKDNERYEILAESEGFKPISGEVQFPEPIAIKEISYRNLGPVESFTSQDLLEFTVKFDDLPGKNFYELKGRFYGPSTTQANSFYSGDLYPRPVNPAYQRDSWTYSGLLFDDVLLSGKDSEIVFRSTFPRDYDLEVTINLSHVSESYYRYEETVGLQNYNRGDFLSQPVLVYTNIQNGMGILKARNTDTKILKILLEN